MQMRRDYSQSRFSAVLFRHRKVKRNAPLVVQTLRKTSIDEVEANLIQTVLYADIMQRSHLHPITKRLHNAVILEGEKVNSRPPFIRDLWLDHFLWTRGSRL